VKVAVDPDLTPAADAGPPVVVALSALDAATAPPVSRENRPPRRPRRPGRRPVAPAPSPAQPDLSTTRASPDAGQSQTNAAAKEVDLQQLGRRLEALEQRRRQKGILLSDLPPYRGALTEVRRAVKARELARARPALDRMAEILSRTHIDKGFIARKLARLSALKGKKKLDDAAAKKVSDAFGRVHSSYFAGDYGAANRHLNGLWQILRPGED
jgi:hypothetical protein